MKLSTITSIAFAVFCCVIFMLSSVANSTSIDYYHHTSICDPYNNDTSDIRNESLYAIVNGSSTDYLFCPITAAYVGGAYHSYDNRMHRVDQITMRVYDASSTYPVYISICCHDYAGTTLYCSSGDSTSWGGTGFDTLIDYPHASCAYDHVANVLVSLPANSRLYSFVHTTVY